MRKATKKVAKTEVKKPAKKSVGKPVRKTAKGVSAKTKVMLSSVCKKFAKANGLPQTYATMMIVGSLFHFAMGRALDNEIKAGRKVKARRALKKELDAAAGKCFETLAFKELKVKPTDVPGMAELMKQYAAEADSMDFSGL